MVKERLLRLETNILGIIINGIVYSGGKRTVLKQIRKEITMSVHELGLDRSEAHSIWLNAVYNYDKISKKTFSSLRRIDSEFGKTDDYVANLERRSNAVYMFARKITDRGESLIKMANSVARDVEFRVKRDQLSDMIADNRADLESYSPFYMCSSHIDPAEDHKDWEGKMYFDSDWKNYVTDDGLRKRISAYIRNRKLRTVQWVCGSPVYLVTRPNCRHFLTVIDVDEALNNSFNKIVKKHELYNPREEALSAEKVVLKRYENRLMIEKYLNAIIKSDKLKDDIDKDIKLVRKWRSVCELIQSGRLEAAKKLAR